MTDSRIWELNGLKPLNPAHLIDDAAEYGWPTDWHGLANGISCPRGKMPGYGHFLVSSATLEALPKTQAGAATSFSIKCKHELGETTFQKYYLIESQAITKQETPAYWIKVADKRHILQFRATGTKRYNMRKSKTEYVAGTGGYTWQTILSDLWGELPAEAGSVPTLQSAPLSTPENLAFDGMSVWDAINQVLTATGHILVYNPLTDAFSFALASSTQAQLASKQTTYKNRVLWDYKPSQLPRINRPIAAKVTFFILPTEENDSSPNFRATPHVETKTIADGIEGTNWPILDPMFYWTGRTAVGDRATEIASALDGLMRCYKEPWGKVYAGCLEFVPGSQVSTVMWLSDGDNGFCTHVRHTETEIDWPKLFMEPTGGASGLYEGTLEALTDGTGHFTGKKVGTVLIDAVPCGMESLLGEEVEVVDWRGCIFDLPFEDLDGVGVFFSADQVSLSQDPLASPGDLTTCYYAAKDRCCVAADGGA